jgi:hypothetical protein
MKRFLALSLFAFAIGMAVSSCGGGEDASADKLTIVGAGS